MIPGTYSFYTIQHRRRAQLPWLKPNGRLKPVRRNKDTIHPDGWSFSSWDFFYGIKPRYGTLADEELAQVHRCLGFGHSGFWSRKHAVACLGRLATANAKGLHDTFGPYGKHCRAVRHDFRIVKVDLSYDMTPD